MENFVVSARKYRPKSFEGVVGQESITKTLKNAISNNLLAQAFLFCGPRGVGKTSCARILAKTINCLNISSKTVACDQCESCNGFNKNNSFNIHEIDAASNNGVDKIRELVDQVRLAPQIGKYNTYIIDEVHMLSQAAFNAFLKTLEEPPSHAIFILATTEKHKIIPTILSRCQIFDFKRIKIHDIAQHLAYISEKEGIVSEKEALHIIAQKADGALRDALSIFDQIISYSVNEISYKSVIQNLNILDYNYFFKITDNLHNSDISSSLVIFNEIIDCGFDGHNFINGLGMHFRNLLLSKDKQTINLLELDENTKKLYIEQSKKWQEQDIINSLELCNKADLNYRISKNQRLLVEITLMQISNLKENQIKTEKKKLIINDGEKINDKKNKINKNEDEKIDLHSKSIKIVNFKEKIEKKTISINPIILNEEKIEKKTDKNQNTFSQIELTKFWQSYINKKQSEGKHNIVSILKNRKPILKNDSIINIELENNLQLEVLNEEKSNILFFLKKELKNDNIAINVELKPLLKEEVKAYTLEEKYNKMADKNSDLNILKDKFNLEIDF